MKILYLNKGCATVQGSVHEGRNMVQFLTENGFAIKHIEHQMNEDDLYFERA